MQDGMFSQIVEMFGGRGQNFLANPKYFRTIYVLSDIWSGIGWNSIIYLAALSSIDQEQYEAARVDGANRFQQMLHITLPGLVPTIMILFILRMGNILNVMAMRRFFFCTTQQLIQLLMLSLLIPTVCHLVEVEIRCIRSQLQSDCLIQLLMFAS